MFGIIFILAVLFVLIGWVLVIKELLKSNKKTASGSHGFDDLYMQQRFAEESTKEALKSVTPFEMGGYNLNQGNSWNDNGCNNFNDSGNGMF
jgi:hypothetical protein